MSTGHAAPPHVARTSSHTTTDVVDDLRFAKACVTEETQRCGNCAQFMSIEPPELARISHFGNCKRLPLWRWRSDIAACFFSPSQWRTGHVG